VTSQVTALPLGAAVVGLLTYVVEKDRVIPGR
jgi:hypothetical protein